jgi:16S rRNA (uracil1498-N3)-methyltransferase
LILFYEPEFAANATCLSEEESRHCVKVLRKREGERITVTDGLGFFYECEIIKASASKCEVITHKKTAEPKRDFRIHIAIAPTKNPDRMEWFVEKVTEMGIDEITLLDCEHSERTFLKTERLKKVAISAMKQSQKATLPIINNLQPLSAILQNKSDQRFIAFVDHANPQHLFGAAKKSGDYLVLIGPEGDFSSKELQGALDSRFTKVSLGHSRLRTETAGLAACCFLNVLNIK